MAARGMTTRAIGEQLNISAASVCRILKTQPQATEGIGRERRIKGNKPPLSPAEIAAYNASIFAEGEAMKRKAKI